MRRPAYAHPAALKSQRRRWPFVVGAILFVLALTVLAAALTAKGMANRYNSSITKMERTFPNMDTRPPRGGHNEQTILVLTVEPDDKIVSYPTAYAGRWESAHLIRVSGDRDTMYVISIPVNMVVSTHDGSPVDLGEAKELGGTVETVALIEDLLGVRINKLAILEDEAIARTAVTLGGSGASSASAPVTDECAKLAAEQEAMAVIAEKAGVPSFFLSPSGPNALIDAAMSNAYTSKDLSFRFLLRTAWEMSAWSGINVEFLIFPTSQVPAEGSQSGGQSGERADEIIPNLEAVGQLRLGLLDDDLAPLVNDPSFTGCH